jgi:dienelactone hydrolase
MHVSKTILGEIVVPQSSSVFGEAFRCEHGTKTLEGRIAAPEGDGPFPAVLMFPGGAGPGKTFNGYAHDLVAAGFFVMTVDIYGAGADLSTDESVRQHFAALMESPELLRDRCVFWLEQLRALSEVDASRIAAIGYCLGGKCVLELARSGSDLVMVTSLHGLLTTHAPAEHGKVKPHISIWSAGCDPYAPLPHLDALRAELDAAEARYQLTLFSDAQHSFTDREHENAGQGIAFDPLASAVAWAGTIAALRHNLGSTGPRISS